MRKSTYNVEKFAPRREKREFPKGFKGIHLCKMCGAVYYRKAWRHNLALKNYRKIIKNFPIKKFICPADLMIKHRQFEGEIKIFNIPAKIKSDLMNLIKYFGERAYQKNDQHRIIKIKHPTKHNITATTTENQMALQLAKKIKSTFKKNKMAISYSPQPSDVVYIKIEFNAEGWL